jgi:hypothetical protein
MNTDMIFTAPGIIAAVEQIAEPVGHWAGFEKTDVESAGRMKTRSATNATTIAAIMK